MNTPNPRPVKFSGKIWCLLKGRAVSIRATFLVCFIATFSFLCPAVEAEEAPLLFLGDKDYPPAAYLEDGVAKGMDVDLAKALAGPMKREIRVELMDWNLAQEKVLNGEADGLMGLSISEERRKLYDFATPSFRRDYGLVVGSDKVSIRGIDDLKGKQVGVTAGGFPRKFMETQSGINLVLIDNYDDGFSRLTNGTIDAMAVDLGVAAFLIERNGIQGLSIVGKPFATAQGAMAIKKGNPALVTEISRAIEVLKKDGTIARIHDNWRPYEMVFASRQKIRGTVTLAVGVALAVLFGVMAMWIITLRKQIHVRKEAELALKLSEERFQLAVRGSNDGLWDWDVRSDDVYYAARFRELLGYESSEDFPSKREIFYSHLHPDDSERTRNAVQEHLTRRTPYDIEYRLRTRTGEYRWFRARGQAIWNDQDEAIRMAGSIADITERKQAEERINLLQMITMDVVTAEDLPSALKVVLRRVCEKTGWTIGQAWVPNENGSALDRSPAWFAQEESLEEFRDLSRYVAFLPGIGLPGRVWKSGQPAWVRDVTQDANFPRSKAALTSGLKAGMAVPILCGKEVIAVLEFFLKEPRAEDERLVKVTAAVAAQIGLVIERKRAEQALRKSEELIRAVVEDQSEMIVRWKPDGTRTFVNEAYCHDFGHTREEVIGKSFFPLLKEKTRKALFLKISSLTPVQPVVMDTRKSVSPAGEVRWHEWTDRALFDAEDRLMEIQSTGRDITKRKRAEELIKAQRHALEMIASGQPMAGTLNALLCMIESQSPAMHCSVLLLDSDGVHIRHCAAPSLPAEYLKAIDGEAIGPCAGSCGTAAFRHEPVFVADIENDPLWADYKQFALPHGLRACWSTPIFDAQQKVLGTFAIYYRRTGLPDEYHQKLINMATDTAAVCIAKHRADEALRESEKQFRAVVEFSPETIVVAVEDRMVYVNPAGAKLVGVEDPAKLIDRSVYDFAPVELHETMKERRWAVLASGVVSPSIVVPMTRLNGETIFVEAIAVPFVYRGRQAILNLIRDITERKRAEEERDETVVREQKALEQFAQQLIASQEAERRRIAGELHDSLGQNLLIIKNRAHLALTEKSLSVDSRAQLEAIDGLVSQAIVEVRQISRDLHPYQIDHLGLTGAIKAMIETTAAASEIKIQSRLDMVDECFSTEAAVNLYRIVQESLNNILKHSGAKQAHIELERDVHEIQLHIEDDGCGFDANDEKIYKGLGLRNMAERVRTLRGNLKVDSQPNQGMRIEVTIPIVEES